MTNAAFLVIKIINGKLVSKSAYLRFCIVDSVVTMMEIKWCTPQ